MDYHKNLDLRNKSRTKEIIREFPEFTNLFFDYCVVQKNYSSNTILNYAVDLRLFFRYLVSANPNLKHINEITLELLESLSALDIQEYLSVIDTYDPTELSENPTDYDKNKCSTASLRKLKKNGTAAKARKVSSLRSFYKYYYNMKMINSNPAAIVSVSQKNKERNQIIRLERDEITNLLEGIDSGATLTDKQKVYAEKTRYRDLAIITLFLGTGIRVSELVGINMWDLNWKNKSVIVRRKGGFDETVYFNDDVAGRLDDYITLERPNLVDIEDEALFLSLKKQRITVRSVERMVKKYTAATVPGKKIAPHKLRSTYGTELYRKTGDIYIVADALGHKSLNVVQRYTDIGTERRQKAGESVDWTNEVVNDIEIQKEE